MSGPGQSFSSSRASPTGISYSYSRRDATRPPDLMFRCASIAGDADSHGHTLAAGEVALAHGLTTMRELAPRVA